MKRVRKYEKLYKGMIGLLLHLAARRPDIQFATCLYAHFQSFSKESHMKAMRRILRYLAGTSELGLFYARTRKFHLITYFDADYAWSKTNRNSTSGTCHIVGDLLVAWLSKKKNCVALSTTEVEYISAALA